MSFNVHAAPIAVPAGYTAPVWRGPYNESGPAFSTQELFSHGMPQSGEVPYKCIFPETPMHALKDYLRSAACFSLFFIPATTLACALIPPHLVGAAVGAAVGTVLSLGIATEATPEQSVYGYVSQGKNGPQFQPQAEYQIGTSWDFPPINLHDANWQSQAWGDMEMAKTLP